MGGSRDTASQDRCNISRVLRRLEATTRITGSRVVVVVVGDCLRGCAPDWRVVAAWTACSEQGGEKGGREGRDMADYIASRVWGTARAEIPGAKSETSRIPCSD
jgi:hypothetical protein